MYWWIAFVAFACACTRPADREAAEKAAADKATGDKASADKASADKASTDTSTDRASPDTSTDKASDASVSVDAEAPPDARAPTIAPTVPTVPTAALGASDAKVAQVETFATMTCARRADGIVRCWGSARPGEVGSVVPVDVSGAPEAASFHLAHGQLAIAARSGDIAMGSVAIGVPKLELVSVGEAIDVRIDAPDRAWALTRTGDVLRIDGTTTSKALLNVIALSSRERDSTDALHRDGTVTTLTRGKAVPVKGITDAEALFATRCAHRKSGGVVCWDTRGKLVAWKGPLNTVDRRSAIGVTCTLAGSGVACLGRNDAGQLGIGPGDDETTMAKIVALPGKPVAIAGADRSWCAVLDSGALACWGANDVGQLGDGTLIDRFTPVVIAGASSAKPLAAPKRGEEPVAEADVEMTWTDLPKGCTRPTTIPLPTRGSIDRVVSAYAVSRVKATELWFADFKLVAGGYRPGHAVARGTQKAVVYTLASKKLERGRYRDGSRAATMRLGAVGAPSAVKADVLVEKVEGGWICGTILDPDDATKRAPFAALISKPRYGD